MGKLIYHPCDSHSPYFFLSDVLSGHLVCCSSHYSEEAEWRNANLLIMLSCELKTV